MFNMHLITKWCEELSVATPSINQAFRGYSDKAKGM